MEKESQAQWTGHLSQNTVQSLKSLTFGTGCSIFITDILLLTLFVSTPNHSLLLSRSTLSFSLFFQKFHHFQCRSSSFAVWACLSCFSAFLFLVSPKRSSVRLRCSSAAAFSAFLLSSCNSLLASVDAVPFSMISFNALSSFVSSQSLQRQLPPFSLLLCTFVRSNVSLSLTLLFDT